MGEGRYCVYEFSDNGTVKKVSLIDFKTKGEAEKSIINSIHPLDRKRLFALKVQY